MIPFDTCQIAKGYAENRPYFHPRVIERIKSYLNLSRNLTMALDVGCGAGLSTIALLEIADRVVGVDASQTMIRSAIQKEGVEYFNYPAEYLPFKKQFELITLSGSLNWVDRASFFSEARKVITDEGFVVIYDNDIIGVMEEDNLFEKWYRSAYLEKFPRPPRDESPILEKEAAGYGFNLEFSENYTNQIQFKMNDFLKYLFTQSNITSALDKKLEAAENIKKWLSSSLSPFFNSQKKSIRFGGYIWYLKKKAAQSLNSE
jgi:SAM-dependent methyltransferase